MTVLKITVDDGQVELVKKLLRGVYVDIEEETETDEKGKQRADPSLDRIKTILANAKGKGLFKDIEDPSEWQRQIRKEWDRDL